MSIIYDALKKVEKTVNAEGFKPSELKDKPNRINLKPLLIYTLIIGLGFITGNLIFQLVTPKERSAPRQVNPVKAVEAEKTRIAQSKPPIAQPTSGQTPPSAITQPQEKAQEHGEAAPEFVLNGIFFSDNENCALINNQIVKVGETVDNAVVKSMNMEEVELDLNGKILKLSSKGL